MVFQFYALYPHLRTRDNIAFPLRAEGLPRGGRHAPCRRGRADAPARAPARPPAEPALRRRAAARRARPRAGPPAPGVPHGRAAHEPRRGDPGRHAHGDQAPAGAARDDDGLRHPRPARGDVARPPDRDPQQGSVGAGRHADGGLRPPGDAVLRPLHRLPADEPRPGLARRRRAARAGRAGARATGRPHARPALRGRRTARGARARRARRRRGPGAGGLRGGAGGRGDLRRGGRWAGPARPDAARDPFRLGRAGRRPPHRRAAAALRPDTELVLHGRSEGP